MHMEVLFPLKQKEAEVKPPPPAVTPLSGGSYHVETGLVRLPDLPFSEWKIHTGDLSASLGASGTAQMFKLVDALKGREICIQTQQGRFAAEKVGSRSQTPR